MNPILAADLIVVAHLGYVAFVIVGLGLIWLGRWCGWRWVHRPLFRWSHLVCTLIVPVEALGGVRCPLTVLEASLRKRAGQLEDELSFMARLTHRVLFYQAPEWVFACAYVLFGLAVLATFFRVPVRRACTDPEPSGRTV